MKHDPLAKTHPPRRRGQTARKARAGWPADRGRVLLLAGLTSIYVARPLLPSETPTTTAGDGLPFVMLTLVLAAAWLLSQFSQPRGSVRFDVPDAAWVVLMGWLAVSAIVASGSGYARAAINGFWEWIGSGIGFLLLRQLLRTATEKRALMVAMMALALVLSLDGLYQFLVELPLARELYRRDPEAVLAEANVIAAPGSPGRALFEQRLASTEPTGTFALANSLAGLLVPWLLVALAVGSLGKDGEQRASLPWPRWLAAALLVLPMAAGLLLTKSRAGYLATLAGFALLALVSRRSGRHVCILMAASAGLAAIFIGVGAAAGALDRQIVSEAFKSLSYRWHYWRGALDIVAEHPWVGCGPGNFQDEYTRFKLPEASEAVADPHNLAFEVWAIAGTPALLALIAVLLGIAFVVFQSVKARPFAERKATFDGGKPLPTQPSAGLLSTDNSDFAWMTIAAAGVAGFVLAYLVGLFATVGLPGPVLVAGGIVLPAVSICLAGWIRRGSLPQYVPLCAALALVINLLVAGGISFSGVAGSLWLLAAAGMNGAERKPLVVPPGALIGLCVLNAALFVACYLTAYRPVLACRRATAQALRHPHSAREHLLAATAADPLADEPWRILTEGDFALWLRDTAGSASTWEDEQREVLRRRPHSSAAWHEAGERYLAAAEQSRGASRDAFLSAAFEHLRRAAELYPNSALVHAHLAMALSAAERPEAGEQAALALKLHSQTPHIDQKLPENVLPAMRAIRIKP